jgi:hypothetical protein
LELTPIIPGDRTSVENWTGKPSTLTANCSQGQLIVAIEKASVNRGSRLPQLSRLDEWGSSYLGSGVAPNRSEAYTRGAWINFQPNDRESGITQIHILLTPPNSGCPENFFRYHRIGSKINH